MCPKFKAIPARLNRFVMTGASVEVCADFNHTGTLDSSDEERDLRVERPGCIVLPNLNLSQGLPGGVPGTDLSTVRDADDDAIQGDEDFQDLTEFMIRTPTTGPLMADAIKLHLRTEDLERCRVFLQNLNAPGTWNAELGKGAANDYSLIFTPNTSWGQKYAIEALTLAGSPAASGPAGATPDRPQPPPASYNREGKGITSGTRQAVYDETGPGEIWLEVVHEKGGAVLRNNYDTAVFLIAPFLLQSNLEPCERVYVVYLKEGGDKPLNHDFVYDLMEGCWAAFGMPGVFDRNSGLAFTPGRPQDLGNADVTTAGSCALSPGKLYLVDASRYDMDEWIQDQFEMGYCSAPGNRSFNLVFHCRRDRGLADFVKQELAHTDIGLFNDIAGVEQDGTDYGGNIEVSPPVNVKTSKQKRSNAGPAIPAHPRAPFGKIILGDYRNPDRSGSGIVHDQTRDVLSAQTIQPIIPINTSWLGVGHVDEFMSFVPANTPRKSALLIGSVLMMDKLLAKIKRIPVANGRTNFHRGKYEAYREMIARAAAGSNIPARCWASYSEISAEDLYNSDHRRYSKTIRKRFMIPIENRLKLCTAHASADVIKVPLYFKIGPDPSKPFGHADNVTVAETVGMVNMQIVNGHLMVPKPFGPRMRKTDAVEVVRSVLGRGTAVQTPPDAGFHFWAWPTLTMAHVAHFFAHPDTQADRQKIIDRINGTSPGPLPTTELRDLVNAKRQEIEAANPGMPLAGGRFTDWHRLFIPENGVDVIEAYMMTVLSRIGRTVHFVDDWYYHVGWGEAHCGTNAKRTPPDEATLAPKWWEVYDPTLDTSYDPGS